MDGQVPALIFIQCLSALQLKEESPAPLTMAPPALLPVLLLSSFLFSPVPEDPSGFLHQAQLPWVICPRASCLLLLCPTPVLLDWVLIPNNASVPHRAGSSTGSRAVSAPTASHSRVQQITGWRQLPRWW